MGVIKKLIFRTKKAVAYLTLSTTSTSATWSPQTVANSGAVLTWDVSGDITPTSQNVNIPIFNLSANIGTVDMDVYDVSDLTVFYCYSNLLTFLNVSECKLLNALFSQDNLLTSLNVSNNTFLEVIFCQSNQLTSIDLSTNTLLQDFYCFSNLLTSLNVSTNIELRTLLCNSNSIPSLDLSNNVNLNYVQCGDNNMLPTATDQIYIDLASGVGINGTLNIRNNRTSASDTARATLVSRGWAFDESYTT